ncbi:sn-glycerol-3-phosphate ABC transporter ATP-binding protein UgpC [bacterium]|nr:sn-glycerol-3-phosphate ABC transporter ATP-binding protein UgpC [bacterium]
MARVELDNVTKRFGETLVVDRMSLAVEDGELLVLVGPSGCGKSTVLRLVAGLEAVTDGTIRIGGSVVNDAAPKDRGVAMVFQSYALYPHMTVYKNMSFALRMQKTEAGEIDRRVRETARVLELEPLLGRKPAQLSGGQRQRVAMGRAMVRDPRVFLFDEPLSNLDAKLRVQMRLELKRLHERLKTTSIYVTHDQMEAMTLAGRIAVMHQGVAQQIATPLEIYDRPNNLFVASFIGSPAMNFLDVNIERGDGGISARAKGFDLPLPGAAESALGERVLGIRPENIRAIADHDERYRPVRVRVDILEPLGASILVFASVDGQTISALVPAGYPVRPGETTTFFINPEHTRLFDKQTGAAIASPRYPEGT